MLRLLRRSNRHRLRLRRDCSIAIDPVLSSSSSSRNHFSDAATITSFTSLAITSSNKPLNSHIHEIPAHLIFLSQGDTIMPSLSRSLEINDTKIPYLLHLTTTKLDDATLLKSTEDSEPKEIVESLKNMGQQSQILCPMHRQLYTQTLELLRLNLEMLIRAQI